MAIPYYVLLSSVDVDWESWGEDVRVFHKEQELTYNIGNEHRLRYLYGQPALQLRASSTQINGQNLSS